VNKLLQSKVESYNDQETTNLDPWYIYRPARLKKLLEKYNISSIFDSGCKDRYWIKFLDFDSINVKYIGGDISSHMVRLSKKLFPTLEILHHDCTTDQFPEVELVLSSDVLIHLNNVDRLKFLQNFLSSNIEYLLMSDSGIHLTENIDANYNDICPMAHVNWNCAPWHFPESLEFIQDTNLDDTDNFIPRPSGLKLWHRTQLVDAIEKVIL
jgi:hypothetical protein